MKNINLISNIQSHQEISDCVAVLKVCARQKNLHKGANVHADILRRGLLERSSHIASTLINMYAKCGDLATAAVVLDELPVRDVISWNSLIAGYIQQGKPEEALKCLNQLQSEGLFPDSITFTCTLKACGLIGAVYTGAQIHHELARQCLLGKDIVLGNALVDMYAKCGALGEAARVIDDLPVRNVASWNSLLAGYVQQGRGYKALNCFELMQTEGIIPTSITLTCVVKACGSIEALEKGEQIYNGVTREGILVKDTVLGTALVDMYSRCGALKKAAHILDELSVRDAVSWSTLIIGYAQQDQAEETLISFERMLNEGLFPNAATCTSIIKACGIIGEVEMGEHMCEQIEQESLGKDMVVRCAMVVMYAKCGALAKARQVFDELSVKNAFIWNALIVGHCRQGQVDEALEYFERMQESGTLPNIITFSCILKACGSLGALDIGKDIHEDIIRRGLLREDTLLGIALVGMYVKSGALAKAAEVFEEIPVRDADTWNALLAGYAKHGQANKAICCYGQMQNDGVLPNPGTFIHILKACSSIQEADMVKQVHNELIKWNLLGKDIVLDNALVDIYAKCGALSQAGQVFDELPVRNVVSWSAIIAGYVHNGQDEDALRCYLGMQHEGHFPDMVIFVFALKACGNIGCAFKGAEMHNEIVREQLLENDIVLSSALVSMYAKCGCLVRAAQLHDELTVHNTISWNVLIMGYVLHWQCEKALSCFKQMQYEGFVPDPVSFTCILKACGSIRAAVRGEQIHGELVRQGLIGNNIVLGNALVDMYVKCNALSKAEQVLDQLPIRDVVSWSILITGYVHEGQTEDALKCIAWMQLEGVALDKVTLTCILKDCCVVGRAGQGEQIYNEVLRDGFLGEERDVVLNTTLMEMFAKSGEVAKAEEVFQELSTLTIDIWNLLIAGYAQQGKNNDALRCFEWLQDGSLSLDMVTYTYILKVYGNLGAGDKGKQVHDEIIRQGLLGEDIVLGNALVDMYVKCGELTKAACVLDDLHIRDIVSWSTLIAGYARQDQGEEALRCFERMQGEGLFPDIVTFACILKACGSIGALSKGEQIHGGISLKGIVRNDLVLGNTLVDMYANCGALAKAEEVFDELPVRDIVSWGVLISGYARERLGKEALKCVVRMEHEGLSPDSVTLACLLSACSRSGLIDEGQTYFASMGSNYGITADVKHNACMIDLYSHAGDFDKALAMAEVTSSPHCLPTWHALLDACRECGNMKLARSAFNKAMQIRS